MALRHGGDGAIRLWKVGDEPGRQLMPLFCLPARGFVNALAVASSGRFVLAGMGREGCVALCMTPIGQPCTCEPMTWLYFVFVQSVFVFVELTLAMGQEPRGGRWARDAQAKNGLLMHRLNLSD